MIKLSGFHDTLQFRIRRSLRAIVPKHDLAAASSVTTRPQLAALSPRKTNRAAGRSRAAPLQAPPGFTRPPCGANPYSKVTDRICRLPEKTFCVLTRDYSSLAPAADIGTAYEWAKSIDRGLRSMIPGTFQGTDGAHPTAPNWRRSSSPRRVSRDERIPHASSGERRRNKSRRHPTPRELTKEDSFQGDPVRRRAFHLRRRWLLCTGANINALPFCGIAVEKRIVRRPIVSR